MIRLHRGKIECRYDSEPLSYISLMLLCFRQDRHHSLDKKCYVRLYCTSLSLGLSSDYIRLYTEYYADGTVV